METNKTCWGVQFLYADGTDANRCDYYTSEDRARYVVRKCTELKTARVRLVKFQAMPHDEETAVNALVDILRLFQQPHTGDDSYEAERDYKVRNLIRKVMRRLEVYDAHGCPLCLS